MRVVSAMTKVTWSSMPMPTKMLEVTSPVTTVRGFGNCLSGRQRNIPERLLRFCTRYIKYQTAKVETQFGFAKNQHQIHQISDSELKNCAMHNNRNFCSTCIILALSKMVDLSISANSFLIGPSGDQANPFNVATIIVSSLFVAISGRYAKFNTLPILTNRLLLYSCEHFCKNFIVWVGQYANI